MAAVVDRLPSTLRVARVAPARRAVVGAILIVAAVLGVLGVRLAMASAAARPVSVGAASGASTPAVSASTEASSPRGSPTRAATGTATAGVSSPASALLVVYVSGRVRHPGVVRLATGLRVQDALKAAGGALPRSDLTSINLAQPLADGEQIMVGRVGSGSSVSSGGSGVASGGGVGGSGAGGAVVDINTGDVTVLDTLPGVGPVLAQRIVDWRSAHGRFTSVDELDEVSGIGDKLMSEIRPHVRV